jgi:RIO-like serine/threonine protein kinase
MRKTKKVKTISRNKRTFKKNFGGEVIGRGSEGCIVNSFTCNKFTNKNYVLKVLRKGSKDNYEQIHRVLQLDDPQEERYALYNVINKGQCTVSPDDLLLSSQILKSLVDTENFYLTRLLYPIDNEKELTRAQYKHLKGSVINLRRIGIHHGDLIGNVMLNAAGLPVIIDWGHNSRLLTDDDSEMVKNFDYVVFMENFASNWGTNSKTKASH